MIETFIQQYGDKPEKVHVFRSPARVNLIGEHIDYNGGLVFPAAISMYITMGIRQRDDKIALFKSKGFERTIEVDLDAPLVFSDEDDWVNYPKGVLKMLMEAGCIVDRGFEVYFESDIPSGSGLSSSAALEVVFGYGIAKLFGYEISNLELALLSQKAENEFVGVQCGIMDQFAVAMGKDEAGMVLDCGTLEYEYAKVELGNYRLVILNSNKSRGLVDSKYNERLSECMTSLDILKQYYKINHLCDLNSDELPKIEEILNDDLLFRRVRHTITENERVKQSQISLDEGDIEKFGELLNASHLSLKVDYEVTGMHLDELQKAALSIDGCIGSRMTGAGFGGCNVSLVKSDSIKTFSKEVIQKYEASTGIKPSVYLTDIVKGVDNI